MVKMELLETDIESSYFSGDNNEASKVIKEYRSLYPRMVFHNSF